MQIQGLPSRVSAAVAEATNYIMTDPDDQAPYDVQVFPVRNDLGDTRAYVVHGEYPRTD